ncbi:DUF5985 family protein [Roseiterribacter gracilis]|uniref:Uncharacterized protein n=1 Tax=Roseiterribacter gracilis TaxID=2812848 RepID=A0A8S8XIR3_9PROT|nr:hypothetical protein TMPK1_33020 [Rhodospirillales bacterium TMPK1]
MVLPMSIGLAFWSGVAAAGYAIAALFFLRFWRRTGDPLFASFAAAFLLLALVPAMSVLLDLPEEQQAWIYLLRLAAFVLIILALIRKNLR